MVDKLLTLIIKLLDKHLVLATTVIGVLTLYLLGFNADNLINMPYTVIALILLSIFIKLATYVHIIFKLEFSEKLASDSSKILEKLDDVADYSKTKAETYNTIITNNQLLNANISKLCDMIEGIPNKPQLKLFISMRTKLYMMEIIEACVSLLYSGSFTDINMMTTMNRKKFQLDLNKKKQDYYKNIIGFINSANLATAQPEVDASISMHIEEIIDLLDSNATQIEKLYNIMIVNTTTEEQLIKIWDHYVRLINDSLSYGSSQEED